MEEDTKEDEEVDEEDNTNGMKVTQEEKDYITYNEENLTEDEEEEELTPEQAKKIYGSINLEELNDFSSSIHNFLTNIYNDTIDEIEEYIVSGASAKK